MHVLRAESDQNNPTNWVSKGSFELTPTSRLYQQEVIQNEGDSNPIRMLLHWLRLTYFNARARLDPPKQATRALHADTT